MLGLQGTWELKHPGTIRVPGLGQAHDLIPGLEESRDSKNPGTPRIPGLQGSRDSKDPGTPRILGLYASWDSMNPGTL